MAGTLTDPALFGMDPLEHEAPADEAFCDHYSFFDTIFHELVNGSDYLFRQGLFF